MLLIMAKITKGIILIPWEWGEWIIILFVNRCFAGPTGETQQSVWLCIKRLCVHIETGFCGLLSGQELCSLWR